jgi:hypothetical protein
VLSGLVTAPQEPVATAPDPDSALFDALIT